MPPRVFSTLTSPSILLPCSVLTFFNSSRFAGMISFNVDLRSSSSEEEYAREKGARMDRTGSG